MTIVKLKLMITVLSLVLLQLGVQLK